MQTRPRAVAFLSLMTLLTPGVTATASATTITFGNPASGEANLFPFSSEYSALFATRYQQVYNEALFSGLSDISAVTFYGVSGPGFAPGTNASGTYTLSLSTTSKPVGGLDTSMANNLGVDSQTFFSGALPPYPPVGALTFPF